MNVHDSERIGGLLELNSYKYTESMNEADIIIFNTCSVRLKAEEKFYTAVGRLKQLKKKKPGLIIIAAGCTAQVAVDEIKKRAPHIDIIIGTRAVKELPQLIRTINSTKKLETLSDTEFRNGIFDAEYDAYSVYKRPSPVRAYVTIMEGCNNFCSYCIVPYTRGREVYRPFGQIVEEAKKLADSGYLELILLGQNVNSYREGKNKFSDLLDAVSSVEGLERVRFITSHPAWLDNETIQVMSERKNICNQLHLPLQAGSNKVLELMNRKYTLEYYMDRVDMLKEYISNISLSTDIIVGFPGENEEDYNATVDALKRVEYDVVFSFVYSIRPGTKAAGMKDETAPELKKKRLIALQAAQRKIQLKLNRAETGKTLKVLVDGTSRKDSEVLSGRTESNKVVNFPGDPDFMHKIVDVRITEATQNSLIGVLKANLDKES